jgi:hypothetical protein
VLLGSDPDSRARAGKNVEFKCISLLGMPGDGQQSLDNVGGAFGAMHDLVRCVSQWGSRRRPSLRAANSLKETFQLGPV